MLVPTIDQTLPTSIEQQTYEKNHTNNTLSNEQTNKNVTNIQNLPLTIQDEDLSSLVAPNNIDSQIYINDSFSSMGSFQQFIPFHSKLDKIRHEQIINLDLQHENINEHIPTLHIEPPNTSIVPQRSDREALTYFRPTVIQNTVSKDQIVS